MSDMTGHDQSIAEQEAAVAEATARAAFYMVEAECRLLACERTLSFYRDQCRIARAEHSKAVRECEVQARGSSGVVLSWRVRLAREAEERLRALVLECERQCAAAWSRHAAALRRRDETAGSDAPARLMGMRALNSRLEQLANALQKAIAQSAATSVEPTKEELKEIRRAIRRSEWSDLPEYHGREARARLECLHCGRSLPADRKRFCSIDCHRMHQEAYGTAAKPKSRAYGADG